MFITPEQIKAARALLRWNQADLARESGISEMTIKNLERGASTPRQITIDALRSALEQGGASFIDGDADNIGGVKQARQ